MRFQTSTLADAPAISALLSAAAARLRDTGRGLWSADEVSVAAVSRHADQGQYRLRLMGDELTGVFRLDAHDPVFWPEMPPGSALYLHKLAVLPARQGQRLAQQLLAHAADAARAAGVPALRLDCAGGRPKLCAVYEQFGFQHHSQWRLGERVFDRFELDLTALVTGQAA